MLLLAFFVGSVARRSVASKSVAQHSGRRIYCNPLCGEWAQQLEHRLKPVFRGTEQLGCGIPPKTG